jgi:integrase
MPKVNGIPKVKFNPLTTKKEVTYLYTLFNYNGHTLRFGSGEKVYTEFWNNETQRLNLNRKHPEHSDINIRLNDLASLVLQIYKDFDNGEILPDEFRNEVEYRMNWKKRPVNEIEKNPTFFEFVEIFIKEKQSQPRGTWKILLTVSNLLREYASQRNKALDYNGIDFAFLSDFKVWLYDAPRLHSTNYAAKILSVLRQFMREAQRRNYHNKTDYQGFSIKKVKTSQLALTFDELEKLYELDLADNPRLERVRDLFLVGSYTGLRFSDFTRIKPENIEVIENETILSITTQKTGEMVDIPLFEIPLAILQKYNYLIPSISNQKMNEYLKELGQMAGMNDKVMMTGSKAGKRTDTILEKWEKISSHVARRSFATNFYRAGIQANVIMKITGHATERQFMQYIKIDGKSNALHFADLQKPKNVLKLAI